MAHVYTPEEILLSRTPIPGRHKEAEKFLREEVESLIKEGLVFGGIRFSSTTSGTYNLASDLDICVITKNGEAHEKLRWILKRIRDQTSVIVEFKPVTSVKRAQEARHGVENFFIDFLGAYATEDNVIGKNPLDILSKREGINYEEEMKETFERYLVDLDDHYFLSVSEPYGDVYCRFLEKILDYPLSIARMMLQWKTDTVPKVGRVEIVMMYQNEFPRIGVKILRKILVVLHKYEKFLENYLLREDPPENLHHEYLRLLGQISNLYKPARAFLEQNDIYIDRYLKKQAA